MTDNESTIQNDNTADAVMPMQPHTSASASRQQRGGTVALTHTRVASTRQRIASAGTQRRLDSLQFRRTCQRASLLPNTYRTALFGLPLNVSRTPPFSVASERLVVRKSLRPTTNSAERSAQSPLSRFINSGPRGADKTVNSLTRLVSYCNFNGLI